MQTIYLDISNKGVIPCVQAKQSEVGRKFLAVITDNGVPYNIPDNSLLSIWYEGDTDAGNYSSIEEKSAFNIDGNKVTVELVAQMLFKPGKGELCLSITHGDGGETNTWNIPYNVEYKPGAGSSVPTEYYTALTEAAALAAEQVGLAREQANIAKESAKVVNSAIMSFLDKAYPVGSIYISATNTSPSTLFGGVWDKIQDRFLISESNSIPAGETGGNKTHTLSVYEMPEHSHYVDDVVYGFSGWTETSQESVLKHEYNSSHTTREVNNSSTIGKWSHSNGSGQSFDIMPPYLAVYMWQRVS